jgi:hypothetical protein
MGMGSKRLLSEDSGSSVTATNTTVKKTNLLVSVPKTQLDCMNTLSKPNYSAKDC